MSVRVERIPQGPIKANTYVVIDEATSHAVVIDAGDCTIAFLNAIRGVTVDAILLTHGHFDHILGVHEVQRITKAPLYIHEKDAICLSDNSWNLSLMNGTPLKESLKADRLLKDGDQIKFGETTLKVLHTPGHTPGGVTYMDEENRLLFTGDTLFCLTAGRTDLRGGNYEELLTSLLRLAHLSGDFTVYPGHNRETTLESERNRNRYMRRMNR